VDDAEMRLVSHTRLDGWTGDFCVAARSCHFEGRTRIETRLRTLSPFVAVVSLALTVASLLVIGGAVFALFTFWPLVLLALIAVLAGLKARMVRQRNPRMNLRQLRRAVAPRPQPVVVRGRVVSRVSRSSLGRKAKRGGLA
jgi:hypothetical protein